jgi:tagatose 1,6-diphosphate aldolase
MKEALKAPMEPGKLCDGHLELQLDRFEMHPVHHVPTYQFLSKDSRTGETLGNIRLSIGSTRHVEMFAGHIGYGVLPEHRGNHYAARAVRLLLPLASALGIDPLWITCDPENIASRRTLEHAGAVFVEAVDVPENCSIHKKLE